MESKSIVQNKILGGKWDFQIFYQSNLEKMFMGAEITMEKIEKESEIEKLKKQLAGKLPTNEATKSLTSNAESFKTSSMDDGSNDAEEEDNQTSFSCYICNKNLGSKNSLKNHVTLHDSMPRFKCSECDESFFQRTTRSAHKKVHK